MGGLRVAGRIPEALRECGRLIQVALDLVKLPDALRIAYTVNKPPAVILEAGTPLVKSYGMEAVSLLRALPGDPLVVADTKTMDTGGLEVELAYEAGADASTVLAVAPDETISEAVARARELGVSIYGDLIGHPDPVEAAKRLRGLGVDIVVVHVGVDVQRRLGIDASSIADVVSRVKEAFGGPVAVAGGVKPGRVRGLVDAGADIVIMGSAVTRSRDPALVVSQALREAGVECGAW
jgi:3-hexulose-6-phosphate synthase